MTTRRDATSPAPADSESDDERPTQLDLPRASEAEADASMATRPVPAIERDARADAGSTQRTGDEGDALADADMTDGEAPVRPQPVARPRKNTLAAAIRRQAGDLAVEQAATAPAAEAEAPAAQPAAATQESTDDLPEGVADEVDEWSIADQPTVYMAPKAQPAKRPQFLETGDGHTWPPRPAAAAEARADTPVRPAPERRVPPTRPGSVPTAPRRDGTSRPFAPDAAGRRSAAAAPDGRISPRTPPGGAPRVGLSNPRLARFQELRRHRAAHDAGERVEDDQRPVAEIVRQWWSDLVPGLSRALDHQHEARASGVHPIPAHVPSATSRLGDAFGRVAASARELTERAQSVAAPTFKRLHNQAEQAAQAIVGKIEGSQARQQAPLLGPGRIAVFFKQGVTMGQAQRLLAASHARPIRLIPRKHGFLALVPPGAEAEIGSRLREHPYVRDVAYLQYDEYGETMTPEE